MRAIISCSVELIAPTGADVDAIRGYLNGTWVWKDSEQDQGDLTNQANPAGFSRGTTNLERIILNHLGQKGWLPHLAQNNRLVEDKRKDILKSIKDDHLELVTQTVLPNVLLHAPAFTWGIMSQPVDFRIEFRLKQPVPHRLRSASESLVRDLQDVELNIAVPIGIPGQESGSGLQTRVTIVPHFEEPIQILEPGSAHQALSGRILLRERWKLARKQKRTDYVVGIFASIIAIMLLLLTTPWVSDYFAAQLPEEWVMWFKGSLDRLATSATFAAVISWVNVLLRYWELRSINAPIEWTPTDEIVSR